MPAGSAFMIRPGEPHTGSSAGPEGYRYRVLYIDLGVVGDLLGSPTAASRLPGSERFQSTWLVRLRAHVSEDTSLKKLAQVCEISVHHLVRSFSASMGMPPHAYQTQLRVWRARTLLFSGVQPAEVALRTGFYDEAHFTRVSKRTRALGQFLSGDLGPSGVRERRG
nr:AraC family transcriptional regulator [Streptomyces alboniger]